MSGWATVAAPRLNGEIPSASANGAEKATLGNLLLHPQQQFRHGVFWCRLRAAQKILPAKTDRFVNVEIFYYFALEASFLKSLKAEQTLLVAKVVSLAFFNN